MLTLLLGVLLIGAAIAIGVQSGWAEPLGGSLYRWDPAALNTLQAGIQRHLWPWLWDDVVLPVLEQPAWLVPAVLGALLLLLRPLRRRRRRRRRA